MSQSRRRLLVLFVGCAVVFSVALSACDGGGGMNGRGDEKVSVSINLTADDGGQLSGCEITFSQNGQTDNFNSCSADKQYAQNSGQIAITGQADNRTARDTSVSTTSSHDISLTLPSETPETVTKTLSATAAGPDTAIAVDFYHDNADTLLAADKKEVTVTFPGSDESISVRAEHKYFDDQRQSVSLSEDGDVPAFALERKSVTVEVLLETMAEEPDLSGAGVTIYEPNKADSTVCTSECTQDLPARSGQRSVRITNRDTHPETGDIRRYDPYTNTFTADEDRSESAELGVLAACDDGIDNEDDGEADENDPGCLNQDGEYDPSDDNEGHVFVRSIWGSGGEGLGGTVFVSSAENERSEEYPIIDLPPSIVDAVVADAEVEIKLQDDQDGEAFVATFKCGSTRDDLSNVNTSGTVQDNNEQDGWDIVEIPEVTTNFFDPGRFCRVVYKHWTLVEDLPPGDGQDDVFFLQKDGETRVFVVLFFVEEEDYPADKNTLVRAQTGSNCSPETAPCTKVRINGYPDRR